jgi:CHAT domain-containing protein
VIFADPDFELSASRRLAQLPAALTRNDPRRVTLRGPLQRATRGGRFERLKETRDEAEDIVKALRGSRWEPVQPPWLFQDAVEERLKQVQSPRLLHLATHGFYYPQQKSAEPPRGTWSRIVAADNPLLRSGLALAGADAWQDQVPEGSRLEDGWVTAEEIALLDLQGTELVVLSACQSGQGDIVPGEGVYGLRRAFFYAGARTVVASLFAVPSQETRSLMEAFYQKLAAGHSKLQALHEAQLDLLRERRRANHGAAHPFFWAGFVCVGEP